MPRPSLGRMKFTAHLQPALIAALKTWAAEEACSASDILERLIERERERRTEQNVTKPNV